MKFWRGFAIAATVAAVAGCASQRDQAQGGFDYLEIDERPPLLVPEGMTAVAQNPNFRIPEAARTDGPLGPSVTIRSPRQVMPLVPGSRVEEGSRAARIWFDAIEDMNNVADWVWEELLALVEDQGYGIEDMQEKDYLRTQMIERDQGSRARAGFFNRLRRDRIDFSAEYSLFVNMQAPTHGRSAMLEVDASNIRYFEDGSERTLPMFLQRELEASFLNDLSMRMQRNFERQRVAQVRSTRALRHAESPQGDPAFALDTSFEAGWVMMPGVFEYLGFIVEDLNQTDGVYMVNYQPGGRRGFFSRLAFWRSSDRGMLDLPRGDDYEFQLDARDGVLYVVIRYRDEVLDEETMDRIFPVLAEAFSEYAD
ncbi:MAG: outer membrane protein assembly factor BamC [Firmicutes bacterium]|nr:outer membrane protein assembly factor BamC [Bacillota bacterium]